ncbi:MAG: thioredoxin family protein [Flavobacteriales bacterium]|jgi:thiol-disulfide isomerase/thioredoxin|tara:strand:+ start:3798 stop:4343 length:546 start_codon:yes stop_codon:yes gene_type:complete
MKKIILLLTLSLLFSCNNSKKPSKNNIKEINEEEYIDLLGVFNKNELKKQPHDFWFKENYTNYELDHDIADQIKPLIKEIEITVFMGTWCSDSRMHSPAFFKLIDYLKIEDRKMKLIAMTLDKTTPDSLEKNQDIINIPTIIFKKNGKEINRIVEFPIETIEKDIFNILSGNDYKNAYADF